MIFTTDIIKSIKNENIKKNSVQEIMATLICPRNNAIIGYTNKANCFNFFLNSKHLYAEPATRIEFLSMGRTSIIF